MTKQTPENLPPDVGLPLIIINPSSGGGSTREKWPEMAADLRAHFGPFNVVFTKQAGDGVKLADRAARSGRRFVIACGGDGTINEVANGILRSGVDVEMGILPSGTGGDLRRTIGFPPSTRETAILLRDGITKMIDVGRVTFAGKDGDTITRHFVNVSSVGLAPSVLERVKTAKGFEWLPGDVLRGKANYAVSALQAILAHEAVMLRVSIDDAEERTFQTIAFCVANARFFGGGMMIAPDARLSDGMFDIVNVGDLSTLKILANAHTLYRGTHESLEEVKTMKARKLKVEAVDPSKEVFLETDGEITGKLPAAYEILPRALRLRVPRQKR